MNEIVIRYPGRCISVNYYKIVGRGGMRTNKTRKDTIQWMKELGNLVLAQEVPASRKLKITLEGYFKDQRSPDLHNLHKVIGDAIADALEVDDKNFRFTDGASHFGYDEPFLRLLVNKY